MSVRVVTDSTAYLPRHLIVELGLEIVSLGVEFDDGTSWRETEVDDATFYAKMAVHDRVPTSSQPRPAELRDAFARIVAEGDEALGVFLSGDMSGTMATAYMARDLVLADRPDASIGIVDSRSNCMQLGFAALSAARAGAAGSSLEEAEAAAGEIIARSRFVFCPATLEYLRRGGRIGSASALLGSMLQIHPILTVEDGKTAPLRKVRTKRRAMAEMVSILAEDVAAFGLRDVCVHHIDDESEGDELAALVKEATDRDAPVYAIGPVIGLHVGPGTTGIVYVTDRPLR